MQSTNQRANALFLALLDTEGSAERIARVSALHLDDLPDGDQASILARVVGMLLLMTDRASSASPAVADVVRTARTAVVRDVFAHRFLGGL